MCIRDRVAGVDVEEIAQPAAGALPLALGDLVDAVHEQQAPPGGQHPVGPAVRLAGVEGDVRGGQEGVGRREAAGAADQSAQRQHERDPVAVLGAGCGHREPLHQRGLAGPGDPAQHHPVVSGERLFHRLRGGGDVRPAGTAGAVVLAGAEGLEAEVGGVQGPAVGGVGQVDAVDREPAVLGGDVGQIAPLEGGVGAAGGRGAGDQLVDPGDQRVLAPGLLHEGAGDKGGPLGEEVHDVQTGGGEQAAVELGGVVGEFAVGVAARAAQARGERLMAEVHRLDVRHGEVAEREQGVGEGVYDGLLLVGVDGPLAALEGLADQLGGELVQGGPVQRAPLAAEGDEPGDPDRAVDQRGARGLGHEELPDQRSDQGGRQPDAYG